MDICEKKLDASIDTIMTNIMYQLTKMEEMQGMVLDANFETIRNNIVKIDKRMRQINKGNYPGDDKGDDWYARIVDAEYISTLWRWNCSKVILIWIR